MARITGIDSIKEVMDKYASSSADFFILKEDGEQARVRFNHKDDKDLDIYVVHKVLLGGKDRYIECLGSENKPCPFCQAGLKPNVRIFISLSDLRDGKNKLWDRGKNEISNIVGLVTRYGALDGREYDIVRHGKKGDTNTTYQMFPLDPTPNSLPEREPICGPDKFILQKTEEEMKKLLNEIGTPGSGSGSGSGNYQAQNKSAGGRMF
jgi:hypothetical protein